MVYDIARKTIYEKQTPSMTLEGEGEILSAENLEVIMDQFGGITVTLETIDLPNGRWSFHLDRRAVAAIKSAVPPPAD